MYPWQANQGTRFLVTASAADAGVPQSDLRTDNHRRIIIPYYQYLSGYRYQWRKKTERKT